MKKRWISFLLALAMLPSLLTGCANPAEGSQEEPGAKSIGVAVNMPIYVDQVTMDAAGVLDAEAVFLSVSPAAKSTLLLPVASGAAVKTGGGAEIDYSNIADGYVMCRFAGSSSKGLKVQITGPSGGAYTYNLPTGSWATFPLSDGNGSYKTTVFQNVEGSKYAALASVSFQVTLTDEFAPFLRPNQYVDYGGATATVAKAEELCANESKPLEQVKIVYQYVVTNLTYDKEKAGSVKSGYLPVLDTVLSEKKGICFDYAALMTGMLRSLGVPCKLVVGYAGTAYHAWVSVWTEETGWIEGVIYFDGSTWQRMDPTFASSANSSASIMSYIGDGSNYTVKYLY